MRKTLSVTVIAVSAMMVMPSAFAASKLAKACKSDLKKFGCTAKTDDEAHECLEKNEKHDQKSDGFTAGCYKAHEAFEKKSGTEEKGEAEHQESGESH